MPPSTLLSLLRECGNAKMALRAGKEAFMPAAPPLDRLPADPQLASAEDVGRAVAEIAWIDARGTELRGECQKLIAALEDRYLAKMVCDVDGVEVSLVDRRKTLEGAVREYCDAHRTELLGDEKKSRAFTHGLLGYRKSPDSIDFSEGYDRSAFLKIVDGACQLIKKVTALAAKTYLFRRIPVETFLEIDYRLDKTRVKRALEDGVINENQLKALGLELRPGTDQFYLKVNAYPVQREASAA